MIIFGEISLGQALTVLAAGIAIIILIRVVRKLFSKQKATLHLTVYYACPKCGWEGHISKYGTNCPKCNHHIKSRGF